MCQNGGWTLGHGDWRSVLVEDANSCPDIWLSGDVKGRDLIGGDLVLVNSGVAQMSQGRLDFGIDLLHLVEG